MAGSILGEPINSSTATLQYSMFSLVSGVTVWGVSHFVLNAQTVWGANVNVEGWTFINSSLSLRLPIGCTTGCTSEIPELFMGGSFITATIGGISQTLELPMGVESAYLNPFGGPIVISSLENPTSPAIFLVATYNVGRIDWYGVQMAGYAAGTFGKSTGQGSFLMNVNSKENLITGIEQDRGTISLTGVGPNGQNIQGTFKGTSVVPMLGATDCSAQFGLPSGTCTMTGLNSTGIMNLHGGNYHIIGAYHTIWNIPAVTFGSTVSGTAYPAVHKGHDHQMEHNSDN